jgi:tape measure domain-containing protein
MIYNAAQRSRGSYQDMSVMVASLKAQTGDTFASVREAAGFAELLTKQFKIAGTDATGISSTMYNLTQALSTGVLRGNDLNIVMSNAPQIVQRIADYMGVTVGEIKKLGADGKITADIVKNAMLGAAEDINAQFESMPMTFGDAVQKVKNMGIRAFQPLGRMISNAINSPQFNAAMNQISNGILNLAAIGTIAFTTIGNMASFAADHMNVIAPIVTGLVAAFALYNGILAVFHYVPLLSAPAGTRFGRFHGEDRYTTNSFERLLRLPMYYGLKPDEVEYICGAIRDFYR